MSSYLTSIRRHVPSLKSTLTKTGVQEVNENENTSNFLTTASTTLSNPPVALTEGDPWCDLTQDEQEALLKRILQFNNFDVERANKQLHSTLHWRSSSAISSKHVDLMYGLPAGIPISVVATHHDHVLTVAIAEKYLKSMVDHSHQQLAVSRMLEYFVYDRDGPRTSKVTVVVDFTNFAFRHVDITGLKNGISIYMNHYPEVIHKVFLVNYPKFLYGVWKAIAPILDARTASRITWVSDRTTLLPQLNDIVPLSKIPTWLGGEADDNEIELFNGSNLNSEQLESRFQ